MQLADVEWRLLRGALVFFVISASIGGALVYGGLSLADEAEQAFRVDNGRFRAARARYLRLDDEKRLIEEFYPRYKELEERGLVGGEQRLSWVETLRAVGRGMKMPSLRYEISSQEEFVPDFNVPTGTYKAYATDMRLRMGLLHEEDLPAILAALNEGADGLFSVSGCSLTRTPNGFAGKIDPRQSNVDAECQLRWLVVRKPEPGA